MRNKYFETTLALFAAFVILVGVTAAANSAIAGDWGTVEIHG